MKRLIRFAILSTLVVSTAALTGCGGTPTEPTTTATSASVSQSAPVDSPSPSATAPEGMALCEYIPDGEAAKLVDPPDASPVPATGTVDVTMHMDAGDVVMNLDRSKAPCTVNSFLSLTSQKYFDDTRCHRLVPDFVLQCGDPTESGVGGPGYRFADELTGSETYPYATLAMANAGADTNGSQFFIVIGHDVLLPASYTVFGSVSEESMSVIESIAAQGGVDPTDPNGSAPKEGGHINTVTQS